MTRRSPVPIAAALGMCAALLLLGAPVLAETPDPPDADAQAAQTQTTTTVSVTGTAPPGPPVALLKFGDSSLRFGTVLQAFYEANQDVNSKGYSQNFYMRRVRFYMIGKLGKVVGPGVQQVEFFFQTDNPRVGNATNTAAKNTSAGLLVQDAFGQWAFGGNAIALQAGLWIVPTLRQTHTSVVTFLGFDSPTWAQQQGAALQANGGRDYGVGFNGYLLDDHFSYRVGVFSGTRQPAVTLPAPVGLAACCRNSPRWAGRFMYDVFDSEKGYTYQGTYRGTKKVLAIAGVVDGQGSYEGFGGDVFFDWPIGPGAVTVEADYMHFSGWGKFYGPTAPAASQIPEQETLYTDAGYYFGSINLQPFVRYEFLHFAAASNTAREQQRFGAGLNYYVMWNNFKIVPYFERVVPKVKPATAQIKDFNRFLVNIQTSL